MGAKGRRDLFDEVPGIGGEVGGQCQLPFDNLVHGFLPILCSEGWLEKRRVKGALWASLQALPLPGRGTASCPHSHPLGEAGLADPVSMSYIRAPRLHQSTARLWPLRTRISGALGARWNHQLGQALPGCPPAPWAQPAAPYMYSMVPQKVWVTTPSWMDSLHSPKSVSLMWPEEECWRGGQAPGHPRGLLNPPHRLTSGYNYTGAPWLLSMMFSGLRSR